MIQFDKKARKVQVSIKALEVAEEKEAIAQYGSSDSGATLGDILGTALKNRDDKRTRARPTSGPGFDRGLLLFSLRSVGGLEAPE